MREIQTINKKLRALADKAMDDKTADEGETKLKSLFKDLNIPYTTDSLIGFLNGAMVAEKMSSEKARSGLSLLLNKILARRERAESTNSNNTRS